MSEYPPLQAKLIYNPKAGAAARSSNTRLQQVLQLLHNANIHVDTAAVEEADEVMEAAAQAVRAGYPLVIACGGDGTIEAAANPLVMTPTTLGILPLGTRNNVARSLRIPLKLDEAVQLLRAGRRHKIGAGLAVVGERRRWFLESFTVGLFSALYPHADAVQKGDFVRARDFFTTFLSSPAADMELLVDGHARYRAKAHALVGVNMPSTGANLRLGADIAYDDEHLDVFVYDRLDKLDFLVYGLDVLTGMPEDPAIQRVRARHLHVRTQPALPVLADGFDLGAGDVEVHMEAHSLNVIVGHL